MRKLHCLLFVLKGLCFSLCNLHDVPLKYESSNKFMVTDNKTVDDFEHPWTTESNICIFLKLYLITGISEWVKGNVLDF